MIAVIYLSILSLLIIAVPIYFYWSTSRQYFLDKALNTFIDVRYEAMMALSRRIEDKTDDEALKAYRELIAVTNVMVHHFDTLKYDLFTAKEMFLKIKLALKTIDQLKDRNDQLLSRLEQQLLKGLLYGFSSAIIFRFNFLAQISFFIACLIVKPGVNSFAEKIINFYNSYASLREKMYHKDNDIVPC